MDSVSPDWHITRDLGDFLDRAGSFLRSEPALHTVQLTVTDALGRSGSATFGEESPYFAWLAGRDGAVRQLGGAGRGPAEQRKIEKQRNYTLGLRRNPGGLGEHPEVDGRHDEQHSPHGPHLLAQSLG